MAARAKALSLALILLLLAAPALSQNPKVLVLTIDGAIGPGTSEMVKDAIDTAVGSYNALVIVLNTPGGQLDATMKIVEAIESSPVPVIGYVEPSGAAWSAGTIILLSTHLAAMGPGSVIGSVEPVTIGPSGNVTPAGSKVVNAVKEYVVERARIHGRNVTAAEKFVTENLNMGPEEALKAGVIELIADNLYDLLQKADGWTVKTVLGNVTLRTAGAQVVAYKPGIGLRILIKLSDPTVYSLLLSLGIMVLMIGLFTPGYLGEILGGLLIVLSLLGMGLFPRAVGSIILLSVGAILLAYELITPGFAFFGFSGITLMVLGLILLMGTPMLVHGAGSTAFWILIPFLIGLVAFASFVLYKAFRAHRRKPVEMGPVGKKGFVREKVGPNRMGFVQVENELWRAVADEEIGVGERIEVVGKEGPILKVRRAQ